jgi:hypothetical protein
MYASRTRFQPVPTLAPIPRKCASRPMRVQADATIRLIEKLLKRPIYASKLCACCWVVAALRISTAADSNLTDWLGKVMGRTMKIFVICATATLAVATFLGRPFKLHIHREASYRTVLGG